jgi:redoxin
MMFVTTPVRGTLDEKETKRVALLTSGWLLAALIAAGPQIRTVDGAVLRPLAPAGAANVLLFIATDCPISNGYAPEIQRICREYAPKGVNCALVYDDVRVTTDAARKHLADYRYEGITAAIDKDGALARQIGATVTPEAAVVDRAGAVRYRGRLDNRYASLGKPRRVVTAHDLVDALDAVLSGKPVAAPETTPVGCFIVPPDMRR